MAKQNILIFAGTTESRLIARYLKDHPVNLFLSVATEYGRESFDDIDYATIISGRVDESGMENILNSERIDLVIDATHPFAKEVTQNIKSACKLAKKDYIRCLREDSEPASPNSSRLLFFPDINDAVKYLNKTDGNIFISTGSKELKQYTTINDYKNRCYARVLSTLESVEASASLGFLGEHLYAMQGPFSKELNVAILHSTDAKFFVTKESGTSGGFEEKVEAAKEAGSTLIVISRPDETGIKLNEIYKYLDKILEKKY